MTSPMNDRPKLSELLNELKEDYLRNLPVKLATIKIYSDQSNWNLLFDEYHKLKGNGKTYGYPDISTVAEKLEFLAQHKEGQDQAVFLDAVALLERMYKSYLENKPFPLEQDAFARSLLALKIK